MTESEVEQLIHELKEQMELPQSQRGFLLKKREIVFLLECIQVGLFIKEANAIGRNV